MRKIFVFNDEPFDDELNKLIDYELNEQPFYLKDQYDYLTKINFCSSSDNRVWKSNIEDIEGGDNFADYCKYIFKILDEEEYFDN